ncbi:MAG: sulfotransferase [Phycisphaerales bacterium]|nr:sulfotransferase [Phycisphaerales bacterium]
MTQVAAAHQRTALTGLDLGDTRDLRIAREGEKNTIWAFGKTRQLFFVTGHARSGTTWLAALLARHPRIFVDGEFQFQELRRGFDLFQRAPYYRATREPVHTVAESCFQDTVRLCIGACSTRSPTRTGLAIAPLGGSRCSFPERRTLSSPATGATSR